MNTELGQTIYQAILECAGLEVAPAPLFIEFDDAFSRLHREIEGVD